MRRFSDEVRSRLPDKALLLDEFEQHVGEWENRFRQFEGMAHRHEVLYQTTHHPTALHIGSLQAAGMSARVVNLANGLVALVNARNAHSSPVVARALFETCAIPLYMRRNLLPRLRKGKTKQVHALLWRLGLATRMDTKVHMWKPIDVDRLVHAMANETDDVLSLDEEDRRLLSALQLESFGEAIRFTYSILSEYTHPNQAAMIISTGMDRVGYTTWTLQPEIGATTVAYAIRPGWLAMRAGGPALDTVMETMEQHPMPLPEGTPEFLLQDLKTPPPEGDTQEDQ